MAEVKKNKWLTPLIEIKNFILKSNNKLFLKRFSEELAEIRFSAASLSFSTLFSLIPFLIVILLFVQSVGGLEAYYPKVETLVLESFKEATGSTVTKYFKKTIVQTKNKTLSFTGILFLVFSMIGLLRNIDLAFHRIWKIKPKKPFFKRMWMHSLMIISLPILIALSIALNSSKLFQDLQQKTDQSIFIAIGLTVFIWILYVVIPDTKVAKYPAMICACIVSGTLAIVQNSFLWFAMNIFKQSKIYGSLASLPIFMLWLLVVWSIILAGTSLTAFLMRHDPEFSTNNT